MGSSIEDIARSWLLDPVWQKVFKHTFDILKDYVSYALVAVGAITLSVRLLTTLSSGDLVCIIIGVKNATEADLGPYPSGGTLGMLNYASTDPLCIRAVFSYFMEYMPYIILLQTLVLIVVEKFSFKIPKVFQKVERFYTNIVEESLFGKDPDVAEDMTDPKSRTDAISRMRQRNEICISLKRSSKIYNAYNMKNFCEVAIVVFLLMVNLGVEVAAEIRNVSAALCVIPVKAFPGVVDYEGEVVFQCRGKKSEFFFLMLWIQSAFLAAHGALSLGALVWCWKFRDVSNLLRKIENMRRSEWEPSLVGEGGGKDFLFLFDLLAHNCGLESTLRVLTHSDDYFYQICKPNLDENCLFVEEDKLKVSWLPADIEKWLRSALSRGEPTQGSIALESYEVTVFPAETVRNTRTLPVKNFTKDNMNEEYSAWFYDLSGGRTEYVLTIACIIGKSRMRGEKVITSLVPYGPERPRNGILEKSGTNQVEIFWDPPKGEFTKYVMCIDKAEIANPEKVGPLLRRNSSLNIVQMTKEAYEKGDVLPDSGEFDQSNLRQIELSSKLVRYTILGLDPGELYTVELSTKTGNVHTRQPIRENVMTRPLPPSALSVTEVTSESCLVQWVAPGRHSCLKEFHVKVAAGDGKLFRKVTLSRTRKSFPFGSMLPASDYDISVSSICVSKHRREESEEERISMTTTPEPVRNLHMEHASPNSMTAKWDPPSSRSTHQQFKYRLLVENPGAKFAQAIDVPGDKTQFNISKLPDPEGSGQTYTIRMFITVITQRENLVQSEAVEAFFHTIPHKPTNVRISDPEAREIR